MTGRKRKAEDDDEMSVSPTSSPAFQSRQLARPNVKRVRGAAGDVAGRSLTLPRLLETLDASQLRHVLQTICEQNPQIGHQVASETPKPTAEATLRVLEDYQQKLREAMPYGQSSSDYIYYRVKQQLAALCEAIADFTPQFLPPAESQNSVSLEFLDGVTDIIHSLPDWESQSYRYHKEGAYHEISKAWALVVQEAAKRGGGFTLHTGGWVHRLSDHHRKSGGRLGGAMEVMASGVGWMGGNPGGPGGSTGESVSGSLLDQIMNGAYSSPVQVGPF